MNIFYGQFLNLRFGSDIILYIISVEIQVSTAPPVRS